MIKNIKNNNAKTYSICITILLIAFSCTLKEGKNPDNTDKQGIQQQPDIKLSDFERKNLNGDKINFSKLSYYRADGTIENQNINSTIVFNDQVFDISTKETVKHFPYTIFIQSFSKSDSGIAISMKANNFIKKAFIRKDYSSLIVLTVKQLSVNNKNQVVKMIFLK